MEKGNVRLATAKVVLWVGIGSMIMLFAGLTSAYIVRQAEGNWLYFSLPATFWYSTAAILLSSLTVNMAMQSIKANEQTKASSFLFVSLFLGLVFAALQFVAWSQLVDAGVYFAGNRSNPSGSFMYVITGLHFAHLVGGLIALLITSIKCSVGKYTSNNYLGISLLAIYWHFLDLLWVYLFLFLFYFNS